MDGGVSKWVCKLDLSHIYPKKFHSLLIVFNSSEECVDGLSIERKQLIQVK